MRRDNLSFESCIRAVKVVVSIFDSGVMSLESKMASGMAIIVAYFGERTTYTSSILSIDSPI